MESPSELSQTRITVREAAGPFPATGPIVDRTCSDTPGARAWNPPNGRTVPPPAAGIGAAYQWRGRQQSYGALCSTVAAWDRHRRHDRTWRSGSVPIALSWARSIMRGLLMAHNTSGGFTDIELAAIKERAAELRAEKGGKKAAAALEDLLKSIQAMPDDQRVIAERVNVIVTEVAPELRPKTWYGQPAWTNAEGKVVVFFHSAAKHGTRYNSLGFEESSHLDDGVMWPTS